MEIQQVMNNNSVVGKFLVKVTRHQYNFGILC